MIYDIYIYMTYIYIWHIYIYIGDYPMKWAMRFAEVQQKSAAEATKAMRWWPPRASATTKWYRCCAQVVRLARRVGDDRTFTCASLNNVYMYIYIYVCIYICMYIYIYVYNIRVLFDCCVFFVIPHDPQDGTRSISFPTSTCLLSGHFQPSPDWGPKSTWNRNAMIGPCIPSHQLSCHNWAVSGSAYT